LQLNVYYIGTSNSVYLRNNSTLFEELEVSIVDLTVANAVFLGGSLNNYITIFLAEGI
jgi:hypothetical protein